jgi:hypothetical protein
MKRPPVKTPPIAPAPAPASPHTSVPSQVPLPETPKKHNPFRVVFEFFVHAAVGTACFAILAGFAIGLSIGFAKLEALTNPPIDPNIVLLTKGAEYGIYLADLALYAIFIWRTGSRMANDL